MILEGRERKGHPLTLGLIETAEPHEYMIYQGLKLPATNGKYTSSEMFGEVDNRTSWQTDGKGQH